MLSVGAGIMRPMGSGVSQGIPQSAPSGPANQFPMANSATGPRINQNSSMNTSSGSIDLNNLDFLDSLDTAGDFNFDSTGANILDDVLGTANR